jgi:hypothetical protein
LLTSKRITQFSFKDRQWEVQLERVRNNAGKRMMDFPGGSERQPVSRYTVMVQTKGPGCEIRKRRIKEDFMGFGLSQIEKWSCY